MSASDTVQNINGYVVKREIGRGGFGVVYLVENTAGEAKALKLLRPTPFLSKNQIEEIISNTRSISEKCSSLNVVLMEDHGNYNECFYIVFKYFRKGSLEHLLKNLRISYEEKIAYLISICETMQKVHERGIIHGDIKPANFLISDDNIPFVTDFYYNISKGKASGMPKGTIEFMSPEQAQGKLFSYSTDIYSLGVMAYFIFTGRSPFSMVKGIRELLSAKVKGEFPEPSSSEGIPPRLCNCIVKAMATKPEDRFESMDEFACELRKCRKEKPSNNKDSCFFKIMNYFTK